MKRPDRYLYPAIFAFEEEGIAVTFPDLPGCNTCGDTQEEAMSMAQDALRGHLAVVEDHGDPLPGPSDIRTIQTKANEVLAFVEAWRIPLRERTVRKNLTVPAHLADAAERAGINFSRVLTEALEERLGRTV